MRLRFPILLCALAIACLGAGERRERPDSLAMETAAGVPARVIRVDLADARVRVAVQVANGCPRAAEPFETLIARSKPTIAVNGSYFSKQSLAPIGDIVADGRQVCAGMMGTAFALTRDKQAVIRRVRWGHAENWDEYETVLACGPALVLDGRVDVHPEAEGFHDPHVMNAAERMGVGVTAGGQMLLVQTMRAVSFEKWAEVMHALGCQSAMNLDAGASLAMHYRGRTLARPARNLTNLLLVYVAPPQT